MNKMNIYGKIQRVIVELQNQEIKKSGKNNFAKFEYFELSDFLPPLNKLLDKYGLYCQFNFFDDIAKLTIRDTETNDIAEYQSPIAAVELKGCHPVQNLGGVQTYLRRYLLINAFAISESELVDSSRQDYVKISETQLQRLRELAKDLDHATSRSVLKSCGYTRASDVTLANYAKVTKKLKDARANRPSQ